MCMPSACVARWGSGSGEHGWSRSLHRATTTSTKRETSRGESLEEAAGEQRLSLLRHAISCPYDAPGTCPTSPHCHLMKRVCAHVTTCREMGSCRYPCCDYVRSCLAGPRCKEDVTSRRRVSPWTVPYGRLGWPAVPENAPQWYGLSPAPAADVWTPPPVTPPPAPRLREQQPPAKVSDADAMCAAALISLAPGPACTDESDEESCHFPFLVKLRQIVSDPANTEIIAWFDDRRELEILDKVRLETEVMPKFFTTHGPRARFASFSRQLNNYGFENTLKGRKGRPVYKHVDPTVVTVDDFRRVRKVCGKSARRQATLNPKHADNAARDATKLPSHHADRARPDSSAGLLGGDPSSAKIFSRTDDASSTSSSTSSSSSRNDDHDFPRPRKHPRRA